MGLERVCKTYDRIIAKCLKYNSYLNGWEKGFVKNVKAMRDSGKVLSFNQAKILYKLRIKIDDLLG
jgi:hypothetical protein